MEGFDRVRPKEKGKRNMCVKIWKGICVSNFENVAQGPHTTSKYLKYSSIFQMLYLHLEFLHEGAKNDIGNDY